MQCCNLHLLDFVAIVDCNHFQELEKKATLFNLLSGSCVFLSVAVDLVIQEIQEPVRFLIETQASVYPQNEKFWPFGKKVLQETYFVRLREVSYNNNDNNLLLIYGTGCDGTNATVLPLHCCYAFQIYQILSHYSVYKEI